MSINSNGNRLDDLGFVAVDFVWGNLPMQPNDERGMAALDPELGSHIIATVGYQGFPAFVQGAPYDDLIPQGTVPSVVGLSSTAAKAAIVAAGFDWGMSTTGVGATSQNNDKIKSQSPAAGSALNTTDPVSIVSYAYVAPGPSTTGPIAGFNRNSSGTSFSVLNGDDAIMYVLGRTVKPTVGDTITVSGASAAAYNRNWTVAAVENNDSYNTGGTAVKITVASGDTFVGTTATGGTWTKTS